MFAICIRQSIYITVIRANSLLAAKAAFNAAIGDRVELHIGNRVALCK